jgi:hypothetical protein
VAPAAVRKIGSSARATRNTIISTGKKHKNPGTPVLKHNIDCPIFGSALIYKELEVQTAVKTAS